MRMHLLMMCAFMAMAAAQPLCDPETQYEKNGQCCKMCGPGNRMSTTGTCDEPQCVECGEDEYQESYTTAVKCKRQPYCDPNKNFERATHASKKKKTICTCKLGFHCSSIECITCVSHTVCLPGEGAEVIGNHAKDTVCEKCPEHTFSSESSWDSVCQRHKKCENDEQVKKAGTATSDTICEKHPRLHGLVIGIVIGVLVVSVLIVVVFMCYKGKQGHSEGSYKHCFKLCFKEEKVELTRVKVLANPTDEEEVTSQEEPLVSTPEENDDGSTDVGFTANGQRVQQDSKTEQLSQEESQMQTLETQMDSHQGPMVGSP
ncbi:tumor necrosis factor receptor superfamily member 5 [Cheilinus undulatus]|uniref:tumor necrosis factor receptor superfamily member 5 n=1 Tax=Cheilinus undulatus TaxID=241271 RepID=UPI001BD38C5D|nr:tumor necrosis factor receptor superfamily member 5 [Cheilinus undulatus]